MTQSSWLQRWPSFDIEEVLSPDQLVLFKTKGVFPYSFRAMDKLQEFRNYVGVPLLINHGGSTHRGARSMQDVYEINKRTRGLDRGWEYSFHLWCAFDLTPQDLKKLSIQGLYNAALSFNKWGGIGRYDTFVHVDDRDNLSGVTTLWDTRINQVTGRVN